MNRINSYDRINKNFLLIYDSILSCCSDTYENLFIGLFESVDERHLKRRAQFATPSIGQWRRVDRRDGDGWVTTAAEFFQSGHSLFVSQRLIKHRGIFHHLVRTLGQRGIEPVVGY